MGGRSVRALTGALVVVLVGLLVTIGIVVTSRGAADDGLTAAQKDVGAAARAEAVAFLTVDHTDMDPLTEAVLAGATGDFARQYEAQRDKLTREAVRNRSVSTAEVVSLGVGDLDDDAATVLVAANTSVTNKFTEGEAQTRYYRLRLDLVREDGRWLTRRLEFVR